MALLTIEKGKQRDCGEIALLYDALNDYLEAHTNYPGWKKGVYPTAEDAERGIDEDSLFVARENGELVGTFILRHTPENGYEKADWGNALDYGDIYVIYTFAVHPSHLRKGTGERLMAFIEDYARETGMKALRLDVYEKNTPAIKLYEKCGFTHTATVDLGYAAYGLGLFELYQKVL